MRAGVTVAGSLLAVALASPAQGKATYLKLEAAVAAADAVAVVQVDRSEPVDPRLPRPKKGYWTWGQRNTFRFVEFVKRAPFVDPSTDKAQVVWGQKDFHCASESFTPGKYLVFVESVEPGEWLPVNHSMGVVRIENDQVEWPYAERFGEKLSLAAAKAAVTKVKASGGPVRFKAEVPGSFFGLYNRWIPSQSHQVIVFHLVDGAPIPWPAAHLFARALVPRAVADQKTYEGWVGTNQRLDVTAAWSDGSLIVRQARSVWGP